MPTPPAAGRRDSWAAGAPAEYSEALLEPLDEVPGAIGREPDEAPVGREPHHGVGVREIEAIEAEVPVPEQAEPPEHAVRAADAEAAQRAGLRVDPEDPAVGDGARTHLALDREAVGGQPVAGRRPSGDHEQEDADRQAEEEPAQVAAPRGEHDTEDRHAADAEHDRRDRRHPLPAAERRGEGVGVYRGQSSRLEKKYGISVAADSGESEPCTALASIDEANSFRIVPAAALAGSVAPIRSRQRAIAPSPSSTIKRL